MVFLALEILSIALYVLAAFDRKRLESQEAGLKYFVLGAFSSAIFLYGVALTYGATGTTSLTGIAKFLATNDLAHTGVLVAGFAFLLVGLGFKVAAAPFHMWTPDVYQGAPTPVTAFMGSATKVAAFAAFLRIFVGTFPLYGIDWRPAVWGLAVLSMVVGTVAALVQTNVKRMLAYSSISHAGFVLIGVQVATALGHVGRPLLSARVRVHGDRRVRRHRRDRAARRQASRPRGVPRARRAPARARRACSRSSCSRRRACR